MSSPVSTASSRYVQRTNRFCGLKNEQPLPSCGALEACFLNKTGDGLLAFELCVENEIHANLHGVHGGYWDCPVDLDAFADAHAWASRPLLSFLTATIAENVLTKPQKVFDYVQCPGVCALGVDDAATCHCWSTVPNVTSLNDTQVYAYLETALAKLHSSYKGPHFMTLSPVTGKHAFKGLTVEQDFSLKRLYLELLRAPGRFGVWPTGAAPIDPLFWPMHPIFDKMTQALRMAPAFAATVNFTWVSGRSGMKLSPPFSLRSTSRGTTRACATRATRRAPSGGASSRSRTSSARARPRPRATTAATATASTTRSSARASSRARTRTPTCGSSSDPTATTSRTSTTSSPRGARATGTRSP